MIPLNELAQELIWCSERLISEEEGLDKLHICREEGRREEEGRRRGVGKEGKRRRRGEERGGGKEGKRRRRGEERGGGKEGKRRRDQY